ncbi:membrane protein [Thermodesulfomicrobium sp. WS]|uniref:CBS domain-containing protein n=1 Tax=Thermodesulfomicrobium sp. WS TaxID=3004129 RepID=UPI00249393F7|nr:CBS domain-containing protein [Thermodesulfomicrobium sp. WS]BDV01624.1 membrane protein [Thermodesulfomicrobium sp. WS]
MSTARDIMTTRVVTLSPDTDITAAARLLLDHDINGAPVVDQDGAIVGILTQSDLVRLQKKLPVPSLFTVLDGFLPLGSLAQYEQEVRRIAAATVADAMTTHVTTITPDTPLEKVASLMVDKKFHTLPVVENGRLVGIVGKKDIIQTLLRP